MPAAAPEEICRNPGSQNQPTHETLLRIRVDGAENDERARNDKQRRGPRVAGNQVSSLLIGPVAPPENEKRSGREAEKDEVGRNHVVEDLLVAARKGDDNRQR